MCSENVRGLAFNVTEFFDCIGDDCSYDHDDRVEINYHITRSNLGSSFCSGFYCLTVSLRSLSMATVLKRPSALVLKKPSSLTKTRGKMASVMVNGTSYKIPKWISKEEALRTLKISVTGQGVKEIFVNQTVIENYYAVDLPVYTTLDCDMRVKIEVQPNGCRGDWVHNFSDDLNMSMLADRVKKDQ